MKKKVLPFILLGAIMALSVNEIFASEIVQKDIEIFSSSEESSENSSRFEGMFSDGQNGVEDRNLSEEGEDSCIEADQSFLYGNIDEYQQNHLELNTYYNAAELIDSWGYILRLNIPQNGRIRIKIEDCDTTIFSGENYFYLPMNSTQWAARYWKEIGVDTVDSGWITVKQGLYIPKFHTQKDFNREAKLIVEYQSSESYFGETENNDTYDMATYIQANVLYEGDYSKYQDIDIYKFQMNNPGLAEIETKRGTKLGYCNLYEEDENGNIYDVKRIYGSARIRIPSGNYYLEFSPNLFSEDSEYSLKVDVEYEDADNNEQEKNNVRSQANEKKTNTTYVGNLNTQEDVDYFTFNIERKSYMALEFRVPRQLKNDTIRISLYDAQLKALQSVKNTSNPYFITEEMIYNPGTYYVRVAKGANYLDFDKDYSFNLKQRPVEIGKNIAGLYFSTISSQQYTGKSITPTFVIKDGNTVLKEGTDYKLSYSNNKNIGSASVKISGIGKYTGTKTIKFNIVPGKISLTSIKQAGKGKLKVAWTKSAGAQGYEIYRYIKPTGIFRKIRTVSNINTLALTDSGLKDNTTYYYKIRGYKKIDGRTYYGAYTSVRNATTEKPTVKLEGIYTFNSKEYGVVKITIVKKNGIYYSKSYGRGGKMNVIKALYKYGNTYKAFYDYKGGDVFYSISNLTASGFKVVFPQISEFSGIYKKQ